MASDFRQLKKLLPKYERFRKPETKTIIVHSPVFVEESQTLLSDLRAQIKEEIGGDESVTEIQKAMLYVKFGLYALDESGNQILTQTTKTVERTPWKKSKYQKPQSPKQ